MSDSIHACADNAEISRPYTIYVCGECIDVDRVLIMRTTLHLLQESSARSSKSRQASASHWEQLDVHALPPSRIARGALQILALAAHAQVVEGGGSRELTVADEDDVEQSSDDEDRVLLEDDDDGDAGTAGLGRGEDDETSDDDEQPSSDEGSNFESQENKGGAELVCTDLASCMSLKLPMHRSRKRSRKAKITWMQTLDTLKRSL